MKFTGPVRGVIGAPGIPGIPEIDAIFPGISGIVFVPGKSVGKSGNVKCFPGNREFVILLPGTPGIDDFTLCDSTFATFL